MIGETKVGDLAGIRVYKFRMLAGEALGGPHLDPALGLGDGRQALLATHVLGHTDPIGSEKCRLIQLEAFSRISLRRWR